MAMGWACEEKLTAVAAGCVGLAIVDPGTIAGGAIAGAGLMGLWGQAKLKDGVGSAALLERVRKRVGAGFGAWAAGHPGAEADIRAADAAMAKHLADCVPPIAELAKTTYDDEDFPAYAAHLIVERLADKDATFSTTSDIRVPAAREFALAVVKGALTEAKSVEPFMLRLTQEVVLLIPQQLQRIERSVEAGFAAQDAQFAEFKVMLSSQLGIPIEVLGREIAAILQLNPATSYAELYDDLRGYKQKHDDLAAQLDAVLVVDNRIAALKADAEAALAAYDHDATDRIFGEMRAVEDERIAAGMKRSAEYADGQAQARMLKRDWQGAAEVWMDASRKLAVFDVEAAGNLQITAGIALYEFGEKFAGGAMDAAIAAFRAALEVCTRDALPAQWAMTQNNLGVALKVLGERSGGEAGIALLAEAVAAYRATLEVYTRDTQPAQWAMTQNNLGNALRVQGTRSGGEAGIALLAEAVAASRAALEVYTRDALSADWAVTQNNLGIALRVQGERSGGEVGIALLAEAVAAYRAALEVLTRDALPAGWAMTQNNLGVALQVLGERSGGEAGIALLAEAVAAYRATLEVYTRDTQPAQWAMTQNNLGIALQLQGTRSGGEAGIALLAEAVAAYRAALEVYTRDALSADWAMTQNNLGVALEVRGERSGGEEGIALLAEAVAAYRAALEVRTRDALPAQWAMTQENIAIALVSLAEADLASRCAHYQAASEAVALALEIYTPEHMPFYHEQSSALLAHIDAAIAEHCLDASTPA